MTSQTEQLGNGEVAAQNAINIATAHIGRGTMVSSAQLCLDNAVACFKARDFQSAHARAQKSLAYSVGILHPAYRRAL